VKFRKRPVVIEAVQWDETQATRLALETSGMISAGHSGHRDRPAECTNLRVHTLEGPMRAQRGDWIIKGGKGEVSLIKAEIFRETYEAVDDTYIDIVFDGPPSHESGRFVEVENPLGQSINAGEWIDRGDGLWALRIGLPAAGSPAPSATGEATTPNPVVGHYTFSDGHHEPLLKSEADAFMAAADEARARRTAQMPDEQSAIHGLFDAWLRLKDLGWNDAIYCPKDGSLFDVIEPGSTGIHQCKYEGAWPTGSWWIVSDGDMCPSNPVLFRAVLPAQPREAK